VSFLIISLLALALGPVLYRLAGAARPTLSGLDGFTLVTISGLVVVHIIPHAVSEAGAPALVLALLGFLGPGLLERHLHRAARQTHMATVVLALAGLLVHSFLDGVALTVPIDPREGEVSLLAIAVVLHQLPVGITLWWLLGSSFGAGVATVTLVANATATALGFALGDASQAALDAQWLSVVQALVAGSLLHVVLHRPAPLSGPRGAAVTDRLSAGIGALAGAALVLYLADTHRPLHTEHGEIAFGPTFFTLALESAPALLLAFLLAGLVQVLLPAASLGWLRTGRPLGEAARGMAFGLPLPICSCGVIPVYASLVQQGVPLTAAMAFLVATPELGIDAVLISMPLLGAELTVIRVVCAAIVALLIGWLVGQFAGRSRTLAPATAAAQPVAMSWAQRIRSGLRYGLVEIVDHTGPWLLLGLAIASLVEPMVHGDWLARLPWGADVLLFALLGMPSYVCASGATPLVAVLIHKGVSPGAAIAFLLTGPATNVTTFGILSRLHGARTALAFSGAIAGLTIGLGLLVNLLFPDGTGLALHEAVLEPQSTLAMSSLAVLSLVFMASVLRQGPRGFLAQVMAPFGAHDEDACGHEHEHEHEHGRDHDHDHAHDRHDHAQQPADACGHCHAHEGGASRG
jgi:hypothetical protein